MSTSLEANFPLGSTTPGENFSTGTSGVVDSDGKYWDYYQTADRGTVTIF